MRCFLIPILGLLLLSGSSIDAANSDDPTKPNIVIMLADDMGFGELQCLNPARGKIKTPHLDSLARDGIIFTDAHSGSSVCTPTRYGLLTGRYAWRTRLQKGVLVGGESLIAQDRLTLPELLAEQGYETAVVGKWHLGMLYDGEKNSGKIPVGAKVTHGPIDRGGFDFVMQTDDSFGQVISALKDAGKFNNTLIICSSDNGTSAPTSKMDQLNEMGHFPSGELRGSKADIWDGGHRVPFIVSWPTVNQSHRRSDALVCLTDIFATAAEIVGVEADDSSAEDSISFYDVLRNHGDGERQSVIHHSVEGQFAIRDKNWKLICCPGSGGWSKPKTKAAMKEAEDSGIYYQLYNMGEDVAEQHNRVASMPEKVSSMRKMLDQQIANGRSTPGTSQKNDVKIVVEKWRK